MYNKEDFPIVFMGTPEFAVPSLDMLVKNNFPVAGVITAPDKPKGRGQKLTPTPVKEYALEQGIPVLQPTNLKNPEFVDELRALKPVLQVVVAFRMLPEVVWNLPEVGTINLHASLLPDYRGAAPINWAIINGETETGLTTFMMQHEIDTGSMIMQKPEPIYEEDNAGTLHDRLKVSGARLVLDTAEAIRTGNYTLKQQEEKSGIKKAPKINKEDCQINWHQPAQAIRNFVRGLSPFPGAYTRLNTTDGAKSFKILDVDVLDQAYDNLKPGEFLSDNQKYLHVQASDFALAVNELQQEGKKSMDISSYLRGNKI